MAVSEDSEEQPQKPARTPVRKSEQAFRTIGEVSDDLNVAPHVLRFWEGKFPQVRPMKRGGKRRYYRPADVAVLTEIRDLLHVQGYTIKGVQKLLRERKRNGVEPQSQEQLPFEPEVDEPLDSQASDHLEYLNKFRSELETIKRRIEDECSDILPQKDA